MIDADLPGSDLIEQGVADLRAGQITTSALLVAIGAPRLRALGIDLPVDLPEDPEHRLFLTLVAQRPDAHAAFNALRRRLVSFQHGLERRRRLAGLPPA